MAKDILHAIAGLSESGKREINSEHVKGEAGTGFEKAGTLGEFECGNCHYFDGKSCGQPDMMKLSHQPRLPNGRVRVSEEDCCEYVHRAGRKDTDEG